MGGIYSVEQGREIIGFSSSQLPLTKYHAAFAEDTESQYADELRRQAYIQTLGGPSFYYFFAYFFFFVTYPLVPV